MVRIWSNYILHLKIFLIFYLEKDLIVCFLLNVLLIFSFIYWFCILFYWFWNTLTAWLKRFKHTRILYIMLFLINNYHIATFFCNMQRNSLYVFTNFSFQNLGWELKIFFLKTRIYGFGNSKIFYLILIWDGVLVVTQKSGCVLSGSWNCIAFWT